jgi:Brp/Blh family beta-carotene 15,15'-monooxygenase
MKQVQFHDNDFRQSLFMVKVVLVGLMILLHQFVVAIPFTSQWIFFGVLVVLTGIPHGALDHQVAKQTSQMNAQKFLTLNFYIRYITPMLVYGICWYLFPTISLYVFLLLSAFHFGETDLPISQPQFSLATMLLQTSYGLLVLSLLLMLHVNEVLPILNQINIFDASLIGFLQTSTAVGYSMAAVLFCFIITVLWFWRINQQGIWPLLKRMGMMLGLLTISSLTLSLPISFAIYFGVWHSMVSLENIRQHLSTINKVSWGSLLMQCIPFSLFSFVGIFLLIYVFKLHQQIDLFLMGLFIGISILTLPHQKVMSQMFGQIRQAPTPV